MKIFIYHRGSGAYYAADGNWVGSHANAVELPSGVEAHDTARRLGTTDLEIHFVFARGRVVRLPVAAASATPQSPTRSTLHSSQMGG